MHGEKNHEVVISGLSGQYPECEDVEELWDRLIKKEDMVTIDNRRWLPGDFDVPPGTGKIKHTEYFDMTFFGIHKKLCDKMDPYARLVLEQGIRAVCDAGVNPGELDGTNTAVIMNSFTAEPTLDLGTVLLNEGPYNVLAFSRCMQANRLSYFMNLTGPSYQIDSASCAGIEAIQHACDLISTGVCSAAIVGSCSLMYKAEASFHYQMMGRLSEDSKTRSFSSDASGFARSEGIVCLFLQRKEHAKRIYGTILGVNLDCFGNKDDQYPGFPRKLYDEFLVETYKKAKVDPKDLVYVEAYGAASKSLDALELNSLSKALLKHRSEPLLIGSIKSNLGHTEGSSSMVSVSKVLLAMDKGMIPPNINYHEPNPDVPDLVSGKLKVVTEPTPLDGGIVAVCELGLVGNCAHIILKANEKAKLPIDEKVGTKVPYLLTMSGRNESNLEKNMKDLENRKIDAEFTLLVNSLYKDGIKNHVYRGYTVISDEPNFYNMIGPAPGGDRRPIWFMYSGMGSQWPTMAKSLMALPIFANAINECHKILEPKGINLLDIVCKDDPTIFDNILHSFVGIAAVQIGLTDVLRAIGVVPDGIIGHSVGELGCAYADGCMTAEQMILAAHARGRASIEATLIRGMMAAVGAGYNQMKNIVPDTIEVACHNSKDSCTLSGPAEDMTVFIAQLKAKGMFAKLVNVANIAYHSQYIKPAAPALLKYLKEIIPEPVKRSSKWVSSSNLECNWDTELARHSSAEYHTNNLLSSVLFEEASSHIPPDAIIIEIAPHGLMQAIVKRSLSQAVHIPITSRFDKNNLLFFHGAIGKMFLAGIPVDLQALYPTAKFPVSRGTPTISPLIDWAREMNFLVAQQVDDPEAESAHCRYVRVDHEDYNMLLSHKINGTITIPSSFYFNEMIKHFTDLRGNEGHPIIMEKIKFLSNCDPDSCAELRFQLLPGRGIIVVSSSETTEIILEGNIKITDAASLNCSVTREVEYTNCGVIGHAVMVDFMRRLGLERDSSLISLRNVTKEGHNVMGTVSWEGDVGKFLMSLLALVEYVESSTSNTLKLFHYADEIMVNLPFLITCSNLQDFSVQYNLINRDLNCEGVRISRIECRNVKLTQRKDNDSLFLIELPQFMPYVNDSSLSHKDCVHMCTQLILENKNPVIDETPIKITEIGTNTELHDAVCEIHKSAKYGALTSLSSFPTEEAFNKQCSSLLLQEDLWIVCAEPPSPATLRSVESIKNGFILTPKHETLSKCKAIFETQVHGRWYCLYSTTQPIKRHYEVVNLNDDYLTKLKNQLATAGKLEGDAVKTIILWGQVDSMITIDNVLEDTRDLPNTHYLQYWLFHGGAPEYNFYDPGFKSQIERDVRMNILENGQWGSLRLKPSSTNSTALDSTMPSKFYFPLSAIAVSNKSVLALGLNIDENPVDVLVPELGVYDYVGADGNMGVGSYDPNSNTFISDRILSWQKPGQWTPEEAATVPLLYSLASYILHHTNNVEFSYVNTILVNRALLPLSQAVISLALHENMRVHATVYGEQEKKKLLEIFPELNPKHIYDCGSVGFFVDVLKNADGGVYKVINNFDDPIMIGPCARCTSLSGVLIYANQSLMNDQTVMGMLTFNGEIVAKGVSVKLLMNSSDDIKVAIKNEITKALHSGRVVPIRSVEFLPSSTLNTEAVIHLISNPNKVVVNTSNIENSVLLQIHDKPELIVEGKMQVGLSFDIAEWLLKRGSRKIFLFSRHSHLSDADLLRLQSLRELYKCAEIEVQHSNQFTTKTQIQKFVEDNVKTGIAMVFFLGSGLKERIEFFDEVSSRILPDCNMICIGKEGGTVCDRRMKKSLPALHVRCSTAHLEGANVVNHLDNLIKESPYTPVVLLKKYVVHRRSVHGLLSNLQYVPDTRDDLVRLMAQCKVSNIAKFVSIPSAGTNIERNRDVYPTFLIPGLQPNRLHKLASQLFCPTVEARIPADASSIDQIANELAKQLLSMPYNMFTLCAEGWGGILALHVAAKLEAKSKYVNLILLDASPASIIKWAENLLTKKVALFRKYLQVSPGVESNMKNLSWDEELQFAVSNSELKDECQKTALTSSLNLLRRRLQSAVDAKPPSNKLNIKCHIFRLQSHAHEDHGLEDYLLNNPTLHTKDSKTRDDMIDEDVSLEVNSLLLYEHKDAANPPIEEYLDCNIIKKHVAHWQNTLLYRVRE